MPTPEPMPYTQSPQPTPFAQTYQAPSPLPGQPMPTAQAQSDAEVAAAIALPLESSDAPAASRKFNWLYASIAGVALLLVVFAGLYFSGVILKDQSTEAVIDSPPSAAASATSSAAEVAVASDMSFTLDSVDSSAYPTITLIVGVHGAYDDSAIADAKVAITERGQPQSIKEKHGSANAKALNIVYVTSVTNSNPPSGETRIVELDIAGSKLSGSYQSPEQSAVTIGDLSYNTDQYPKVNVYFSLYDSNDNPLEDFDGAQSAVSITEDGTAPSNVTFGKLAQLPQSISTNLVIDVSGSMEEDDKLARVQTAATSFLSQAEFGANDVVGLMQFSDESNIQQYDFTQNIDSVQNTINGLYTNGCTALYEALNQAVSNTAYNDRDGLKYVVVFTDGKNELCDGSTNWVSPNTVINNALQWGVPIYAIGVEQDSDLQRIAEETNGKYILLGDDITQLNGIYSDIYNRKKNQFVLSYESAIAGKKERSLAINLNLPNHYSSGAVAVSPKLLDNRDVSDAMQKYQIAWSQAMNARSMDPLVPYVTLPLDALDKNSVYNIVDAQINGDITSSGSRSGGLVNLKYDESVVYNIPDYKLVDANKVSNDLYQLRVEKRVQRDATVLVNRNKPELGTYPPLTTYKETAYTYNVVRDDGAWKVQSVEEENVVPVCYMDSTYTEKYDRQDHANTQANGNCPGVAPKER
ncbi:vWA domain-containing protein [Cohnella yongneupensis]|uniref:VWA domain-containing protein n=1 Tax=Cohnella yongneupensis TaxID=425006 RepID=A0ABW0QVK3_9BACL